MKSFIDDNFLLTTDFAQRLYHEYAANQPIYDYHCHLDPALIANDHKFANLSEIWLQGDHYKWRAMRANGAAESCVSGNGAALEKFKAWAATVPNTIGNPLFHWTHLELRRPFGFTEKLLCPETADEIWTFCNDKLAQPEFSARGIIQQMNVQLIGTTDDPIDSLAHHATIAADSSFKTKVLPSWRPDKVYNLQAADYVSYLERLEAASGVTIVDFSSLTSALSQRLDHFAAHGCKIADHSLETVPYKSASEAELSAILQQRKDGKSVTKEQIDAFRTGVLLFLAAEYSQRGWVQQYHIGALRNTNSRLLQELGPDTGFDSINDTVIAEPLALLLDAQERTNTLPKTILYCLNPRDNEVIATMIGNFQSGGGVGKMQFGSAWWFNDQKDGMERQLMQLSQLGLLSRFVGMLTDSRSFLSYTRHEYFRRVLCAMLGRWVENGEAPADLALLGNMVKNISFNNARDYFGIELES